MIGSIIGIGVIGVLGAVSESLVESNRTKEAIKIGAFAGIGSTIIVNAIRVMKIIYKG